MPNVKWEPIVGSHFVLPAAVVLEECSGQECSGHQWSGQEFWGGKGSLQPGPGGYSRSVAAQSDLFSSLFSSDDLLRLSDYVCERWRSGADRDWSVPAGTLDWTCRKAADHAVDCVFAPAFFLASRKLDAYPDMGADYSVGPNARSDQLIQALQVACRILAATIEQCGPDVRAVIFLRPQTLTAPAADFAPRGAMELVLHAHDVCMGLQVPYEPPQDLCVRLRDHTRSWPMWSRDWSVLSCTDDAWGDLLSASGRARYN